MSCFRDFRLFVGLGNPGTKYIGTRHNVGFMAIEKFAKAHRVDFREQKKIYGQLAELKTGARSLRFLKPATFMNESGRSIRATLDWFDLEVDQLVVLVDDMDLPLGRLRLRSQGSSGGHNGLNSTIQHLGTENFCRLRIGIGPPSEIQQARKEMTVSHVLGTFNKQEVPIVAEVLDEVILGLDLITRLGIEKAGNHLNSYKPKEYQSSD